MTGCHDTRKRRSLSVEVTSLPRPGAGCCARGGDDGLAGPAFAELCELYWYPLYAYLRRAGHQPHDAEDLVQAYFVWLQEKEVVGRADPHRGRFRSFLLAGLNQFVLRQRRHDMASKRRARTPAVSIDRDLIEGGYQELSHDVTPDRLFDYTWAVSVIKVALRRLQQEREAAGKGRQFRQLQGFITGQRNTSGREAARLLGVSEGTVRVAVLRLKRRFGEILREEVGQTLESSADVEDELNQLQAALQIT